MHSEGYVLIYLPEHPRAHNGYVYQHIVEWEKANGQPLPEGWTVHHRNEIKTDNRPENLEAMSRPDHVRHHMTPEKAREMQRKTVDARKQNGSYAHELRSHCKYGHPLVAGNVGPAPGRKRARRCLTCHRERERKRREDRRKND